MSSPHSHIHRYRYADDRKHYVKAGTEATISGKANIFP
jgi:hypothetical protein